MYSFPWQCLTICLLFILLFSDICSSSSSPSEPVLCSPDQSLALLHFKNSFSIKYNDDDDFYTCSDHVPKTESWKEDSNCCSWNGITCDPFTGHVIHLNLSCSWLFGNLYPNSSLFHLRHLQQLNLAYNDFNGSEIPSMFGYFTKLTHLDLSHSNFSGLVPLEMSYLSNLESLNLSVPVTIDQHRFDRLAYNLTHLRVLHLENVSLSSVTPSSLVNLPTSLVFLFLINNELQGRFPNDIFRFPLLQELCIAFNGPFTGFLPTSNRSSLLKLLNFYYSPFHGDLPDAIGDLGNLEVLAIEHSGFHGRIPASISKLNKLIYLSLRGNKFTGELPSSIFNLTQLFEVDFSSNHLSGTVNSDLFAKLTNLDRVKFSNNRDLSLASHGNLNFSLPYLTFFEFYSCNLSEFPSFSKNSIQLTDLDLSNNSIAGEISGEELGLLQNLEYLNLSYNFLTRVVLTPLRKLFALDLQFNLLQGPLIVPHHAANIMFFSASHNNMTGEIPSTFCNMSSVRYLVLANNSFSGKIPQCLETFNKLEVLDLRINHFSGSIPGIFPNGSDLKTINLNDNQLEGPIPTSMANCQSLEVLDIGNNHLNGIFPPWLASLPELKVLILRSNQFNGRIHDSKTRFSFAKLQILDIAVNQFIGILPTRLFESLRNMMHIHENNTSEPIGSGNYYDSVVLSWKGQGRRFEPILTMVTAIDLSSNQFEGKIPEAIGELKSLKVLNLSDNHFMGKIPSALTNLKELESLDLSSNKLAGEIPMQLTKLTSLTKLNLSYNKLVGPIPQGYQFNTFEEDAYRGNSKLCGLPLSRKCFNDEVPKPADQTINGEEDPWKFNWKIIMMGYASGLVIGLSIEYMIFATGRPLWFLRIYYRVRYRMERNANRNRERRN